MRNLARRPQGYIKGYRLSRKDANNANVWRFWLGFGGEAVQPAIFCDSLDVLTNPSFYDKMLKVVEGYRMDNFKGYVRVKEASEILGVSIMTLHRWDAKGKLKPFRHPINNYRLYKVSELRKLLRKITKTKK